MNAPLNPPRCRPRDADLCHEIYALTAKLGRGPTIAEISRWAGFGPGIGSPRVHGLLRRSLATVKRAEVVTPNGVRSCWSVRLTTKGTKAAETSHGILGSPRALAEPLWVEPSALKPPKWKRDQDTAHRPTNPRFAPGQVKGPRELVCMIDNEVMTRCLACGFELAMTKTWWLSKSDHPCRNCARCIHPARAAWLADVPAVREATQEERYELLDLFLEEVGLAPFTDEERLDIALAYIAEHHPQHVCTLEQVAAVLGVTRERVRQIQAKAETKLRARLSRDGHAAGIVEELRDLDITRHGEA